MKSNKEKPSGDVRHQLWPMLLRTRQVMYKTQERELQAYGITASSSGIMRTALELGEKAIPSEIARQLCLEPHSVSEQLKRMENEGLVTRNRDLSRKNLVRIELTEKGYEAYLTSSRRESADTIMAALNQREQLELLRILAKLQKAVVKYTGVERVNP